MTEHLPFAPKTLASSPAVRNGPVALSASTETAVRPAPNRILLFHPSHSERTALRCMLNGLNYVIQEATSTGEVFTALSGGSIDMVITDNGVLQGIGSALCNVLKSFFRMRSIPVLMISDQHQPRREALGVLAGADNILLQPVTRQTICARVEALLSRKPLLASVDDLESSLLALAQAVEARDHATGQHCQRVALICSTLGGALELSEEQIATLQRGAFLHDIGKIAVPDEILFKRGPLSPEEWTVMKDHTTCGEQICASMKSLHSVLPIIRHHHERWDGGGYPDGLKGSDIPFLARIIQVADIYDALTTDRPYKKAFSPERALQILNDEVKSGWRDPDVMEAFHTVFPILRDVDLSSPSSLVALGLTLGPVPPQPSVAARTIDPLLKKAM